MSTPAAILLREGGWEGKTNAHTELRFYKLVYHNCYLVLYLNSKNHMHKKINEARFVYFMCYVLASLLLIYFSHYAF